MTAALDRLCAAERTTRRLEAGELGSDGAVGADVIRAAFELNAMRPVLGLPAEGGDNRAPAAILRQMHRDDLIRETAARHFAELSVAACARQLAAELSRYRAAGWSGGDCMKPQSPHRVGSLRAYLWAILKVDDQSIGDESIRKILPSR